MTEKKIKLLIAKRMKEIGISSYRLSKMTGISQSTLSEWWNDHHGMSASNLLKILEALGFSVV